MTKISVVMPAYKTEQTIDASISSVLDQTFSDWELIVINDGSPDNVVSVVEKWSCQENRIRLIRQANQGVSSARNQGIKEATGDYIAFLDSDDIWDSTFLEKMVSEAEKNSCDFVYSGFLKGEFGKRMKPLGSPYHAGNILAAYSEGNQPMWLCATLTSRKWLENQGIQFTKGLRYMEDVEFLSKILSQTTKVGVVPENLAFYCRRETSATGSGWSPNQEDMVKSLGNAMIFVQDCYQEEDREIILEAIRANQYSRLIRLLWGAILRREDQFARYLLEQYPEILQQGGRNIGHSMKCYFGKRPNFWKLIRIFNKV